MEEARLVTTDSKRQRNPNIYGDRTVHAEAGEWKLVRYDRAGKWYEEYEPDRMRPAREISVRLAAILAIRYGAEIHEGLPGGRVFEARVRELRAKEAEVV